MNAGSIMFTIADLHVILVRYADVPKSVLLDAPQVPLVPLEADPVGILALQLELEKRYGVVVPENVDWWSMTIRSVVDYIDALIRSGR